MQPPDDPATLVPETRAWNEGRGIGIEDWIGCVGSFDLAVGYSVVFWPRFVRFEGYVLREGFCLASLRAFEDATNGDAAAVEGVMNHLHLADLHAAGPEPSEAQLRHLGRTLADIHDAKLRRDVPDLRFEVLFNDEPGLDPIDYEFTFRQRR